MPWEGIGPALKPQEQGLRKVSRTWGRIMSAPQPATASD